MTSGTIFYVETKCPSENTPTLIAFLIASCVTLHCSISFYEASKNQFSERHDRHRVLSRHLGVHCKLIWDGKLLLRLNPLIYISNRQSAILSVRLLETTVNESILQDVSVNIMNLKFGISVNIAATLLYDVEKVLAYGRVSIPENRDDKYFKKEILSTTVDIDKIFKGIATNFITKSIINDLQANLNFEPKFPLKRVS